MNKNYSLETEKPRNQTSWKPFKKYSTLHKSTFKSTVHYTNWREQYV